MELKLNLTVKKITFGQTRGIVLDPGDDQDQEIKKLVDQLGQVVKVKFDW